MAPRAGFASGSVMNFAENAHCSCVMHKLRQQQERGRFCDVVLHVDGRQYRAHRSVLAACSPYFDSILRMQKVAVEHLSISCRNQAAFQSFLRYMYSGCVSVHRGNVADLLQLSNHFLIFKLKNYCAEYLEHNLNLANCLAIREMAEANNVPTLLKAVASFVSENVEDVLSDPRLLRLDRERFVAFISDRRLCLPQGAPLLNLVTRWVSHDLEEREGWLRLLLTYVDWAVIDQNTLSQCLSRDPVFKLSRRCLHFLLETLDSNMVEAPKCSSAEKREQLRLEFSQAPESDWESFMNLAVSAAIEALCAEMSGEARGSPGAPRSAAEEEDDDETLSSDDCGELLDEDDGSENTLGMGEDVIHLRQQQAAVDDENSTEGESDEKHHILRNLLVGKEDTEAAKTSEPEATTDDSSNGQTAKLPSFVWKAGVKCEHCSYVSYGAARLEQHVTKAHGKGKTYACPMCTYTCKWNREYYTHMKHHFSSDGEGPFQCDSCAYKCERIQLLLLHRMRHTDERPYQCGACDYRCRQKTNLVAHMRCHTGERPFACDLCGRAFALKCTLEQHLQSHRNDRPYLCDVCGFTAKYQSHLLSHRRLHTGNVFRCQFAGCTYVSPKRSQLEAHMRTHTAVRSHVCAVCGRAFIERSHLVRHERIHLDDKPFKCLECDYTSSRRDKLKEHHEKHHGENATAKAPYRPRKTSSSAGQMLVDSAQLSLDDTYVSTDSQLDPTDPEGRYLVVQMQASGLSLSQIQALQSHSSLDDSSSMMFVDQQGSLLDTQLDLSVDNPEEILSVTLNEPLNSSSEISATSSELSNVNPFMTFF
ncbi:zinc finger protein 16 isoform X1 [Rhipicephalus sanguineus]|uniref:Zinc finger protein n=1 Tax=Rhipicephalus sanguineus TaxID=34632 RepID=A0A9D4T6K8_RHISA|nr:zinc finger protein 16 isoform X1 [Rhipicephalus sanguineus]KAH7975310.1 hypothetical protein HPB52_000571 [Rhipicephalus sanguineus]